MKIVYMGTPEFAVGPLEALLDAGHEILAVVTQPDRPKGRSAKLQPSPVKICAQAHGIPVLQPKRIKAPEAVEALRRLQADVFVAAAFGQILSQEILDLPRFGCLCIHASLLPAYRGAAPIQWAILNGETQSGITVIRMDAGIDTGDMLAKAVVPIGEGETDESLSRKLMETGSRLIVETLPALESGQLKPEKQNDADSSYAKMLTKEMGRIDWTRSAAGIERQVRGLHSWPGAYCGYGGKQLKILAARAAEDVDSSLPKVPGTILSVTSDSVWAAAGQGALQILEVQLEGRKKMAVRDFLHGCPMKKGERLE